jgi:hypothetical protein
MSKLPSKSAVAYLPGNPDGSRKKCANCYAWDQAKKSCAIHAADLAVPAEAVCTYHIFGEPQGKKHMATMPPKLSGLAVVPGGTSCDICIAHDADRGVCKSIDPDDNKVDPKGCCGMWYQADERKDIRLIKSNHEIKRRTTFQGMSIAVETDKGQERHWRDPATGTSGTTKMRYPYGYFEGTKRSGLSGDGMALDVFVGPVDDAENVYVVHQMKGPSFTQEDELKVMLGFETEKQARASYLSHYNDERFLGTIDTMTLAAFKEKYIEPFAKALAGKDVGMLPSSAAGTSALQSPNTSGVQSPIIPDAPMPVRMPGLPMMGPGALMSPQMMPPPIDVESFDGVKSLLNRVGAMKDGELLSTAEKIWGPGYQFVNATPEHIRCELRGFLLDQRDMLQVLQDMQEQAMSQLQIPPPQPAPMQPQLPGLPGQMSSPSSNPLSGSPANGGAVLAVVSLPQGGSATPSSNSSSTPAPSPSPLKEDSQRSGYMPMSSDS